MKRRDLLKLAALSGLPLTLGTPTRAHAKANLSGSILGLTTLDDNGAEQSALFSLDLRRAHHNFANLGAYRFGHSLEPLNNGRWLAVPYGDDSMGCLVLDQSGAIERSFPAPEGMGFGGHAAVFPDGNFALLHFNQSRRTTISEGLAAIVDTRTGRTTHQARTNILHAHDIILARNGHIIVADDGVVESDTAPLLLQPIRPSFHYFGQDLRLLRSVPMPVNGAVVHIAEDENQNIVGGVEQYVRRSPAGSKILERILASDPDNYIRQFDPEIFSEDLPLPGPIVSVSREGAFSKEAFSPLHQDPFDMTYNPISKVMCCVFTESNIIAVKTNGNWHHVKTKEFGLSSPFGLVSIPNTPLVVVNGFEKGVAVFDSHTMQLEHYFDVPTQGVKHISYAPE